MFLPIYFKNYNFIPKSQAQEIHEGLQNLKRMVSNLENKQKTVLGVALPEESECVHLGPDLSSDHPWNMPDEWFKGLKVEYVVFLSAQVWRKSCRLIERR